jgi:two-component system CheB/CheR fusion protein
LGNLLNNARKFTPRGGHIWFTVGRVESSPAERPTETPIGAGPQVAIRVRDTGIGIAADQMGRVFNLFAQVDTSLERSVTGLGIVLNGYEAARRIRELQCDKKPLLVALTGSRQE